MVQHGIFALDSLQKDFIMTLDEAKVLLSGCIRDELRDHAFGDAEVYWSKSGDEVAHGYFSGKNADVYFVNERDSFKDDEARQLRNCGHSGRFSRNDETGPDIFSEGKIMPGLTKEGVFREITGD